MKATNHIKSNLVKINFYNRMTNICQPLSGGRNSSPQNSGEIMANINLSRPVYRSNGNCIKNCTEADSRQIRGIENINILLSKITDGELKHFLFMRITEANCTNIYRGVVAKKWDWVTFENKSEVLNLINDNKKMLNI